MKGTRITLAKPAQTTKLIMLAAGLIILGRGISTKLAPLIPARSETILSEIIRKIDSTSAAKMIRDDGRIMRIPMMLQTNVTTHEKMTIKAHLHLTRLRAVSGDE